MELLVKDLHKNYGNVKALDGVTCRFTPGIYGILGANGAGKSTLINLITDNVKRDKGKESGCILFKDEKITGDKYKDILDMGADFRRLIGYMPQQQGFYEDFSPMAFLKYMAHIKGVKSIHLKNGKVRTVDEQIEALLSIVNLNDAAYKKIGGFSGGMKQRVLFAQALLGNPKVLILDEPTAGLDPKERVTIRNFISKLSKNRIVLYTTHVVSDIESIADEVLLIKKGKIIKKGTPSELIASLNENGKDSDLEDVYMYYFNDGR